MSHQQYHLRLIPAIISEHLKSAASGFAHRMRERSQLDLRLKTIDPTHLFYKKEKEILYFGKGEGDLDSQGLFLIDDSKIILETYRVLTALHAEMLDFVHNPHKSLRTCPFYNEDLGVLNTEVEENLDLDAAFSSYTQLAALNPYDPSTLAFLGKINFKLGKGSEAVKHYEELLRVLRKRYDDDWPRRDIAAALHNLGLSYHNLGDDNKAIAYYEESLEISKRIYGDKPHTNIAFILDYLGAAYMVLGKINNAVQCCDQSYAMYLEIYGSDHLSTQTVKTHLDFAQSKASSSSQEGLS